MSYDREGFAGDASTPITAESAAEKTDSQAAQRVQHTLTEMHDHRRAFRRNFSMSQLPDDQHFLFQQQLVDLLEELRPYRSQVSSKWSDATPWHGGLDELLPRATQTYTEKEVEEVGWGRFREKEVEKANLIDPHTLIGISYDLDDIATQLGLNLAETGGETDGDGDGV